jgi:hypothetical protein
VYAGRSDAQGRNFIICMPIVRMFLSAYDRDQRLQFGLLSETGFYAGQLVNAAARRRYMGKHATESRLGCLITSVDQFSCSAGKVLPGDILMSIDGREVSEKGSVLFRGLEYVPHQYLITSKLPGETVTLKLLRCVETKSMGADGKEVSCREMTEVKVDLCLAPLKPLSPRVLDVDYIPRWVIIGGLVLVIYGSPLLSWKYKKKRSDIQFEGVFGARIRQFIDEEIVMLIDVLAHNINVTYDMPIGIPLRFFNGTPVRNLKHLAQLFDGFMKSIPPTRPTVPDAKPLFIELGFKAFDHQLDDECVAVFDPYDIKASEDEIFEANKVSNWCSPELLEG